MNPFTRLLEYMPNEPMEMIADIMGMDKKKLETTLENKAVTFQTEESGSLLYNNSDTQGMTVTIKCSQGHNIDLTAKSSSLQCTHKVSDTQFCGMNPPDVVIKNTAITQTKKFMMQYNNSLFSLQPNKAKDSGNEVNLPIVRGGPTAEFESLVSDTVCRVNHRLHNLEQTFQNKELSKHPELKEIMIDAASRVQRVKQLGTYEKIQFGGICAKIKMDKLSCRHYKLLNATRHSNAQKAN